jgi:hypothetical protein
MRQIYDMKLSFLPLYQFQYSELLNGLQDKTNVF